MLKNRWQTYEIKRVFTASLSVSKILLHEQKPCIFLLALSRVVDCKGTTFYFG
jgi:hypothetical protein